MHNPKVDHSRPSSSSEVDDHAMDLGTDETNAVIGGRCKSLMNFIRRAFSLREKRPRAESEVTPQNSIDLEPFGRERFSLLTNSDAASTSFVTPTVAPSVYEDPFVAVTADGFIHIKYYFVFNNRIEFHMEDVHLPHMKHMSRVIDVSRVKTVFYAAGEDCTDEQVCKTWGMCRNDVWWASHLNRMEKGNIFTNVVLEEGSTIRPGFSICNIEAFAESLQCVGLSKEAPFQLGLPSPPFNALQIPYIDEDEDDLNTNQEGSSGTSSV